MFTMIFSAALAQYVTPDEINTKEKTELNEIAENMLNALIGKKYWIVPNSKAIRRNKFESADENEKLLDQSIFFVAESTSFIIIGNIKQEYDNYLKVKFQDGKIGYLKVNLLFKIYPKEYPAIENLYSGSGERYDFNEYIYSRPLEEIIAIEKKVAVSQQKTAAAWKARGGVRIGMTAAQARNSNWGNPQKINRSTNSRITHEQWVYGGNNYLYFENGILTSFQN